MHRRRTVVSLISTVVALVVATVGVGALVMVATPDTSQAVTSARPYALTLGDSYSIGYQPGRGGTPGYSSYIARRLKLQVANFGCGGATTSSLLHSRGCGDPASQDAVAYTGITQEQAVLTFIGSHPGKVALVTVSIGGNDFDGCSTAACVQAAMPAMGANISSLLGSLRTALTNASDTPAPIIGLTYPDVNLGLYVFPANPPTAANVAAAQQSVAAFDVLINPTLNQAYGSVSGASFVNVTSAPYPSAARGNDTPLTTTHYSPPYGKVPAAVAEVCKLTWFCALGNIHATTQGYNFIGSLVVARFRSL